MIHHLSQVEQQEPGVLQEKKERTLSHTKDIRAKTRRYIVLRKSPSGQLRSGIAVCLELVGNLLDQPLEWQSPEEHVVDFW